MVMKMPTEGFRAMLLSKNRNLKAEKDLSCFQFHVSGFVMLITVFQSQTGNLATGDFSALLIKILLC